MDLHQPLGLSPKTSADRLLFSIPVYNLKVFLFEKLVSLMEAGYGSA
jgi:hypothetical protein